jgi:alpha-beta hydrolase superfamily lysophospholipase
MKQTMSSLAAHALFKPNTVMVARDGYQLAKYTWPVPTDHIKADVLLVHGLGEHAGRYNHVAHVLQQEGYRVHAYDHYGHGQSDGIRGNLLHKNQLTQDLKYMAESVKQNLPLVMVGHSMGGLVVQRLVSQHPEQADAVVLSSPALAVYTKLIDKLLLAIVPRWFPHLCVDNALNTTWLARDAQVVRDYKHDPLVHRKISAMLGLWIVEQGHEALAQAMSWQTSSLLLYAGQDMLVDPKGSHAFTQLANDSVLQSHCFNVMYHEIFNDPEKKAVFQKMTDWLNAKFA